MAIYHLHVSTGSKSAGASGSIRHDYITRSGDYERDADSLVYSDSQNMPQWARDPSDFWSAADTHERANGRLYQEVEFALPRELDRNQQLELAKDFAHDLTVEHRLPYTLAIHSDGKNPHAHLIYSERATDGYERTRDQHFSRANSKSPELGGAPKVTTLRGSDWVKQVRKDWEVSANAALERAKTVTRIDCRSNEDRGLDQIPQIHLGVQAAAMMRQGIATERSIEWERRQEIRSLERQLYAMEGERENVAYGYDFSANLNPVQDLLDRDAAAYEAQLEREHAEQAIAQQLEQERSERERALEKQQEAKRAEAQKSLEAQRSKSPPEPSQASRPSAPLDALAQEHLRNGGRIERLVPGVSVTGIRLEGYCYIPSRDQNYALVQDEKDPKRMVAVPIDEPELARSRCAEGRRIRISCIRNNIGEICVVSTRKDQEHERNLSRGR